MVDFVLKISQFSMNIEYKIDHNLMTKNRKIYFSFISAHCVSSIKTGSKLREGGDGLHILSWEIPKFFYSSNLLKRITLFYRKEPGCRNDNLYLPRTTASRVGIVTRIT